MFYRKFLPSFWTGRTGRACCTDSSEAVNIAIYLFTGPESNPIGLYRLPVATLANDTGTTIKNAQRILQLLERLDFLKYDTTSQVVWVIKMASFQIGPLSKTSPIPDGRVAWVLKQLANLPPNPFTVEFRRYYKSILSLPRLRGGTLKRTLGCTPNPSQKGHLQGQIAVSTEAGTDTETEAKEKTMHYPSGVCSGKEANDLTNDTHTARHGISSNVTPLPEAHARRQLRKIHKDTFPKQANPLKPTEDGLAPPPEELN